MTAQHKQLSEITANNVALRDQYIVVGGETIRLPQPPELIAYLTKVLATHSAGPTFLKTPTYRSSIPTCRRIRDKMITAAWTPSRCPCAWPSSVSTPMSQEPDATGVVGGSGRVQHTVILGEPGSGKTTALERLAWVTANDSLAQREWRRGATVVPIFARLADYQGEPTCCPCCAAC